MKVLMVSPAFYPAWEYGGIVPASFRMAQELTKRGVEVAVVSTDALSQNRRQRDARRCEDGIEIRYFRTMSNTLAWNRMFISPGLDLALREAIRWCDLVHALDARFISNVLAQRYAKEEGKPYVITPLNPFKSYARKVAIKRLFDYAFGLRMLCEADAVIAQSDEEVESLVKRGVRPRRIRLIPNGIDTNEFDCGVTSGTFRDAYRISRDRRIVLFLGRIEHVKGVDLLATAFSRVLKRKELSSTILVIAGPDAGYLSSLKELVRSLGIQTSVVFTGPILGARKIAAYRDADVFVMPSRQEEFGIAPLEAYACGIPVVVTDRCGVNSWMKDRFDIVVKCDVLSMEAALVTLLTNPTSKKGIDHDHRVRVLNEHFSWDGITAKTLEIYRELSGE